MRKKGSLIGQAVLVIIVILIGFFLTKRLIATKPKIKKVRPPEVAPVVKVREVRPSPVQIEITGEGTVRPTREIDLVSEVSGKVISVSQNLVTGGQFREGELLVKIDDADYRATLKKAEAELKSLTAQLDRLKEESREARREWEELNPGTEPPPLLLKTPEIEATEASIEAARASIERAKLDLKRTEIRAPFEGIVISESVDIGAYLRSGQSFGRVAALDAVEIPVGINEREVSFMEIPGINTAQQIGSEAEIEATIGGRVFKWTGVITRAGVVDEKTRTIPLFVRVDNPYSKLPPLSLGSFVKVRIKGREVSGAYLLPKSAVEWSEEGSPYVWRVGKDERLIKTAVTILTSRNGEYVIRSGLKDADRVVINPPTSASEKMKVRVEK
ncbi:MAG: efflux RND transporter periplasmic adaptor subunit [Nitrospirae bacterium]|nr:MAG: efflux RND transporter periplasmic adaptor subunit [Nitrospirota bacterium]